MHCFLRILGLTNRNPNRGLVPLELLPIDLVHGAKGKLGGRIDVERWELGTKVGHLIARHAIHNNHVTFGSPISHGMKGLTDAVNGAHDVCLYGGPHSGTVLPLTEFSGAYNAGIAHQNVHTS